MPFPISLVPRYSREITLESLYPVGQRLYYIFARVPQAVSRVGTVGWAKKKKKELFVLAEITTRSAVSVN